MSSLALHLALSARDWIFFRSGGEGSLSGALLLLLLSLWWTVSVLVSEATYRSWFLKEGSEEAWARHWQVSACGEWQVT